MMDYYLYHSLGYPFSIRYNSQTYWVLMVRRVNQIEKPGEIFNFPVRALTQLGVVFSDEVYDGVDFPSISMDDTHGELHYTVWNSTFQCWNAFQPFFDKKTRMHTHTNAKFSEFTFCGGLDVNLMISDSNLNYLRFFKDSFKNRICQYLMESGMVINNKQVPASYVKNLTLACSGEAPLEFHRLTYYSDVDTLKLIEVINPSGLSHEARKKLKELSADWPAVTHVNYFVTRNAWGDTRYVFRSDNEHNARGIPFYVYPTYDPVFNASCYAIEAYFVFEPEKQKRPLLEGTGNKYAGSFSNAHLIPAPVPETVSVPTKLIVDRSLAGVQEVL
jgi:hypothetical protein